MKRLLTSAAMFLCSLLSFAQYSGAGNGTENDPYKIYNENQLYEVRNFLNQEGVVFILMKDIDLTSWIAENNPKQGWLPIGVESSPFKGVFYGNNHKIKGLSINRNSTNYVGFFGNLSGAKIDNLTIEGSSIIGKNNVGVFFGYVSGSTVKNCHVKMTGNDGVVGNSCVGALAGYSSNTDYDTFSSSASVTSTEKTGGIIGCVDNGIFTDGTVSGTVVGTGNYTGGLIGWARACTLTNIGVNCPVTGKGYTGGMMGYCEAGNLNGCIYEGDLSGEHYVGGLSGSLETTTFFADCFTKCKINGSGDYVGGVVGISKGACISSMENCSHFGDITGLSHVGGLVGGTSSGGDTPILKTYDTKGRYTDLLKQGNSSTNNVNNCTVIGNVKGGSFTGGLIGCEAAAYSYKPESHTYGFPSGSKIYYTIYYRNSTSLKLTNNYYSGNVQGTDNVGGLVGYKSGGALQYNYAYATVYGSSNVGGIVGNVNGENITDCYNITTIKSNVSINSIVSASSSNVGRIYGIADYADIGDLASAEDNRALTQMRVILQGVVQEVDDDSQNGSSIGPSLLKLKANYVSWGWDFDNNWNILETESFPYKKYQAAPPVIYEDLLISKATTISGKSINGGTVYMCYKNRDAVSTVSNGHEWSFSTEPLQSGAQVRVYADVEGMTPSYFATSFVKYPGSGTEEDPYRIYSAEDLQGASNRGYYKLMNDIDLTSWINENSPTEGWPAIGRNSGEITYIDGDNHKVTGLWMDTDENYNGLFSNFSAGQIKNLSVEVASGKKVKGGDYTGVLIGRNANGRLVNCTVKGDVEGTIHTGGVAGYVLASTIRDISFNGSVSSSSDEAFVGGLVGRAEDCTVSSCNTKAIVNQSGTGGKAGGLIGEPNGGIIKTSSSDGSVNVTGDNSYAGGLVGYALSDIENCYSTTKTTGTLYSAGLVGYTYNKIDKCYAKGDVYGSRYGAGVVGVLHGPQAVLTNSVACNNIVSLSAGSSWGCRVIGNFNNGALDPDESNYALSTMQVSLNNVPKTITDDNVEGIAKTQEVLQKQNTYELLGWDFTDVWEIDEGRGYPTLQAVVISDDGGEDKPINPDGPETVYVTDIAALSDAIYAESISSQSGTEATLTIYLKNAKAATAYSFDLLLPKGVSMVKDNNGDYQYTLSNRHNGHSETVNYQSGTGFYSMAVVSLQTKEVKGNDGAIWTIKLKIADNVANGDYAIKISNAKYSLTSGSSKVNMPETISKLTICQYVKGDVNSDGDVDIADVVCIINHVVGLPTPSFVEQAADANGDGDVDIADAVRIINFVVGKINALSRGNGSLARAATRAGDVTDVMSIDDASVFVGKDGTLTVSLKNVQATSAYSFDLVLPEGVSILRNGEGDYLFELSDRHNGHTGILNYKGDNTYGFAVASMQSKEVKGNEGAICTLKLKVDDKATIGKYPVVIKNAKYSLMSGASKVTMREAIGQLMIKKLGDASGDGDVTEADINAVAKHIMGQAIDYFDKDAADVNGDKVVNAADIVEIVKIIKSK